MSKKTVVAAIALISVGIVFGAIIVSSFSGANFSLAGNPEIEFNVTPPVKPSPDALSLNQTFTQVSKAVTPTVVSIMVLAKPDIRGHDLFRFYNPDQQDQEHYERGSGSGVILTSDGYILTNNHVVKNAKEDGISVTLSDGREFKAKLVGKDPNTDIGVIKISAKDLVPASIGNSDDVQVGEWVLAVGNPLSLNSTVTAGIVSALSRNIEIIRDAEGNRNPYGIENFIQTDAAINPGNSGGALVNLSGQLVGINTAIASTDRMYQGYGFAIPINLAKTVANAIIKEGKFVRGIIGVQIKTLDDKTARALRLPMTNGVMVDKVNKGSAGEDAGLKDGDVILKVDGREVKSSQQLQSTVGIHRPGEVVSLTIFRDEKTFDVKVKLKAREEEKETSSATNTEIDPDADTDVTKPTSFEKIGFSVKPLDMKTKKTLNVESGVVISSVTPYSQAAENGIVPGQVIFEARIGKKVTKITSVASLKTFINERLSGESFLLRVVRDQNGDSSHIPLEIPE